MEEKIQVCTLDNGRVLAKVLPLGPLAVADTVDGAVEVVKRAHRACVRQQPRWALPGANLDALRYEVVGAGP